MEITRIRIILPIKSLLLFTFFNLFSFVLCEVCVVVGGLEESIDDTIYVLLNPLSLFRMISQLKKLILAVMVVYQFKYVFFEGADVGGMALLRHLKQPSQKLNHQLINCLSVAEVNNCIKLFH